MMLMIIELNFDMKQLLKCFQTVSMKNCETHLISFFRIQFAMRCDVIAVLSAAKETVPFYNEQLKCSWVC